MLGKKLLTLKRKNKNDNLMSLTCEIIEIFETRLGIIAAIEFESNIPYVGMILQNQKNNTWRVKGLGMGRKDIIEGKSRSYWDCILEPVNHEDSIKKGDFLSYISRIIR